MTSNSRQASGGRRRRTRVAAVLNGTFSGAQAGDITFVRLRVRMSMGYFLSGLLIPAFITSIIFYMPWGAPTFFTLSALLFGLSLAAHRLNAALQATEMVYFVRKVFEDLPQPEVMPLGAETPDVVLRTEAETRYAGFSEQWQKFYEQKTEK